MVSIAFWPLSSPSVAYVLPSLLLPFLLSPCFFLPLKQKNRRQGRRHEDKTVSLKAKRGERFQVTRSFCILLIFVRSALSFFWPLERGEDTAVHRDELTGDEVSGRRGQEQHSLCHFLGLAPASGGGSVADELIELLVLD